MKAFNSYSAIMFDPAQLRKIVTELANRLPALMCEHDFDTIAVTGKSGCAIGFALSMVTGIKVVYVRKGETSHGDMIESGGHEFTRYAFLDDFIASGASQRRVQKELERYCERRPSDVAPQCVFLIEYAKNSSTSYVTERGPLKSLHVAAADYLSDNQRLNLTL